MSESSRFRSMADSKYTATAVRSLAEDAGALREFVLAAAELLEIRRNRDCKPCAMSYVQYNMKIEEAWKRLKEAAESCECS